MNEISIKIYETHPRIIAVCDSNLLGKNFEEGKVQIEIREDFYKGNFYSLEEAEKILKKLSEDYCSFNIVGEKSIEIAIKLNLINKENILYIRGIPIAISLI